MSKGSKIARITGIVAIMGVVGPGLGCRHLCEIEGKLPALNRELGQAVANTSRLNRVMNPQSRQPGLIQNLRSASGGVTNVDATLVQLNGSLTNLGAGMTTVRGNLNSLSGAMVDLTTPLGKLSDEVSRIQGDLTNLHLGILRLSAGLGTLDGQIGGNVPEGNGNLPTPGLVGRLVRTEIALVSNTVAIAQVNASLATNNHLLGESTNALKGLDSLKNALPLLAAMLTLMGTVWTAVNLGNAARKSAWDKLKGKSPNMIASGVAAYRTGGLSAAGRDIGSAIASIQDFRDAYAYGGFQLVVASAMITIFFHDDIVKVEWLTMALIFLLLTGFLSLFVLYHGDKRDVKLMFNDEWPLTGECSCLYWLCPPVFALIGMGNRK